jgi:hypothetical protein
MLEIKRFFVRLGLLAFAFIGATESRASEYTGNELFSHCQAVANAQSDGRGGFLLESSYASGICIGTLMSIWYFGALVNDAETRERILHFCVPLGTRATEVQLAHIFYNYVRLNPERLSEPAAIVVNEAMIKAFPCGKSAE